jgi:glycosyltransferase involved in cell wall biosynthesis
MPWRYDVVGFLGGDFGLATAARNTLLALRASGRSAVEVPVEHQGPSSIQRARRTVPQARGERRISLFHMNPMDVAGLEKQWRRALELEAPAVCVPFWEMPHVPRAWEPMLEAMQAVLAPSRFVQEACARAVSSDRVVHYPQGVFLPSGVTPHRERWNLGPRSTVFAISFDTGSDIERKNPWAGIEAFRRAFPVQGDVQLVVKMKPWPGVPEYQALAAQLKARVAGDGRVVVVEEDLRYEDVLQLYASCDVMVSLHRSEGLGLHLMEAMSLGRVAVATNWSGNTDFMDPGNSVPINFRLVPVAPRHPHYASEVGRPGQVWADPDVDAAAEALRALHANPDRRSALGSKAAAAMETRRQDMLSGRAFARLEERIGTESGHPGRFAAALRRTRRARRWVTLRSLVRAAAGRVGLP